MCFEIKPNYDHDVSFPTIRFESILIMNSFLEYGFSHGTINSTCTEISINGVDVLKQN